ncbi:HAD family hydrolase [Longispora sp. K20-0274]|uniref:HAD family hydrolase n=1 Tax=Longispora sp. K20-0274 TaxID=3088255 RepID=UPI00399B6A48
MTLDLGAPASGPVRAVLFDFFGTLTHAVARGAEHDRVAELLGVSPAALGDALSETFYSRATGAWGDLPATIRMLAGRLGVRPSEERVRDACTARMDVLRHDARLRADAVATLAALRSRDIRVGLVSDCTNELPLLWSTLAVAPYVQATVFSFETGYCKPDPAMYSTAYKALDVLPEECLYVGDGGSNELTGALRAGLRPIRLLAPDAAEHLTYNAEPDWRGPTIPSLSGVLAHCGA